MPGTTTQLHEAIALSHTKRPKNKMGHKRTRTQNLSQKTTIKQQHKSIENKSLTE